MEELTLKEKAEKYDNIKKIFSKTRKKLLQLRDGCDRENPIDMDMVKTEKAMFFEKIRKEVM